MIVKAIAAAVALLATVGGSVMAGEPQTTHTNLPIEIDSDLTQAHMLCASHVTQVCTSNPPRPCGYSQGWGDYCSEIEARVRKIEGTEDAKRRRAEQVQRELDFVRGVAGAKSD